MTIVDELVTILGIKIAGDAVMQGTKFGQMVESVGKYATAASAALMSAATAVAYFTQQSSHAAAEINKFSKITGISTDDVQALGYAVEQAGGHASSLQSDLDGLTKSMSSPIPGEFNRELLLFGVNVGKAKTAADVLDQINQRMQGRSQISKTQWGSRLGLSNDTILLVSKTRDEYKRLQAEAYERGIVSPEALERSQKFEASIAAVKNRFDNIKMAIAGNLAPTLERILKRFDDWIDKNRELINDSLVDFIEGFATGVKKASNVIKNLWMGLKTLFPGLTEFWQKLDKHKVVLSLIVGILTTGAVAVGVWAAGYLQTAAAITSVTYALSGVIDKLGLAEDANDSFVESFKTKYPTIVKYIGSVVEALKPLITAIKEQLSFEKLESTLTNLALVVNVIWNALEKLVMIMLSLPTAANSALHGDFKGALAAFKEGLFAPNSLPDIINTQGGTHYPVPARTGGVGGAATTNNNTFNINSTDPKGVANEVSQRMDYTRGPITLVTPGVQ